MARPGIAPVLRLLGATGTVTGSRLPVDPTPANVLVDCAFRPRARAAARYSKVPPRSRCSAVTCRCARVPAFSVHADRSELLGGLRAARHPRSARVDCGGTARPGSRAIGLNRAPMVDQPAASHRHGGVTHDTLRSCFA